VDVRTSDGEETNSYNTFTVKPGDRLRIFLRFHCFSDKWLNITSNKSRTRPPFYT